MTGEVQPVVEVDGLTEEWLQRAAEESMRLQALRREADLQTDVA